MMEPDQKTAQDLNIYQCHGPTFLVQLWHHIPQTYFNNDVGNYLGLYNAQGCPCCTILQGVDML